MHQLYVVLMKKRDPTTQVTFLENISEVSQIRWGDRWGDLFSKYDLVNMYIK